MTGVSNIRKNVTKIESQARNIDIEPSIVPVI